MLARNFAALKPLFSRASSYCEMNMSCWMHFTCQLDHPAHILFNSISLIGKLNYLVDSQLFTISPLSRRRIVKKRIQSPTCIYQLVIVVETMREDFVIDHVPDKTHVPIWPYSSPSLQDILLNLMTHPDLQNFREFPPKYGFDNPKP